MTTTQPSIEPQSITMNNDAETIADAKNQHAQLDNLRSTDGIDYVQVKHQASELLKLRRRLLKADKMTLYDELGTRLYPEFASKFPQFFLNIKTCEKERLGEMEEIMHMLLDKLDSVKKGEMSHTEMREEIFEKKLAEKYLKKN